jgi:hypothetical protein
MRDAVKVTIPILSRRIDDRWWPNSDVREAGLTVGQRPKQDVPELLSERLKTTQHGH